MEFERFLDWLNSNCKELIRTKTLKNRADIKAELIENRRFLLIYYSKKDQCCCLTIENLKLIFDRYFSLGDKKHMSSEYTDPKWQNTPNRICAPYAAALIRDFENDLEAQ
jgi:hypothetical protein